MFPLEHFLVALLPILAYALIRNRQLPSKGLLFAVFLGSQFPDLIDKPLAYWVGILPSGRVFTHSLPIAIPIAVIVLGYGWRTDRLQIAGGFVAAYLFHLLGDTYRVLLTGQIPPMLVWPSVTLQRHSRLPSWAGIDGINVRMWNLFSLLVLTVILAILIRDVWTHRDSITHRG
ncbi:metal-dependent hydrolase [Halorubrum sp. GN12_10-3_MGM]|uniref:metal-dependent hydrolase n=1 Tax=Halorubrum sp. GN12_10-3_MGM TaxID=2518113 RepID=UPI0010F91D3C|nr:metal-dependent hydrolase [Halorubrum sp. GN12_10-3_MGM]TKX61873.1 metal-dependent hydrolase [Halorubrum sp. GN12_10-3_MGM]